MELQEYLTSLVDQKVIPELVNYGGLQVYIDGGRYDGFFLIENEIQVREVTFLPPNATALYAATMDVIGRLRVEAAMPLAEEALRADTEQISGITGLAGLDRVHHFVDNEPRLPSGAEREVVVEGKLVTKKKK